jgi:hypothetical protein
MKQQLNEVQRLQQIAGINGDMNYVLKLDRKAIGTFNRGELVEWFKSKGIEQLELTDKEGGLVDDEGDEDRYSVEQGVNLMIETRVIWCWNEELAQYRNPDLTDEQGDCVEIRVGRK